MFQLVNVFMCCKAVWSILEGHLFICVDKLLWNIHNSYISFKGNGYTCKGAGTPFPELVLPPFCKGKKENWFQRGTIFPL